MRALLAILLISSNSYSYVIAAENATVSAKDNDLSTAVQVPKPSTAPVPDPVPSHNQPSVLSSILNHGNALSTLFALQLNQMMMASFASLLGLPSRNAHGLTGLAPPFGQPTAVEPIATQAIEKPSVEGKDLSIKLKEPSLRSLLASTMTERLLQNSFGTDTEIATNPLMSSVLLSFLAKSMDLDALCAKNGGECIASSECYGEPGFICGSDSVCCKQGLRLHFSVNTGNNYHYGRKSRRRKRVGARKASKDPGAKKANIEITTGDAPAKKPDKPKKKKAAKIKKSKGSSSSEEDGDITVKRSNGDIYIGKRTNGNGNGFQGMMYLGDSTADFGSWEFGKKK